MISPISTLTTILITSGNILAQTTKQPLADPTQNANLKAYYPFDIDFRDYSISKLPNAVSAGSTTSPVTLACENDGLASHRCSCYANILAPAYLNIPAVQFQKSDFAWAWSARVPKKAVRQMFFTNWGTNQWQFTSFIDYYGCFYVQLRRNVPTDGFNNPYQFLVDATSSKCNLWSAWTDYDVTWSRKTSTLKIYVNGALAGTGTVPSSMSSTFTSDTFVGTTTLHQFGAKLDTVGASDSVFTGAVRDFRIYNGTSEPQFQDRCKNSFGYWKKF